MIFQESETVELKAIVVEDIKKKSLLLQAVREALLNLLVHREYSFRASTFISLYADRLEFTSIGGLVSGVSLKDITMGISVCRNTKLANVFYRLELIETYGTGIIKIMEAYEGTGMTPQYYKKRNRNTAWYRSVIMRTAAKKQKWLKTVC